MDMSLSEINLKEDWEDNKCARARHLGVARSIAMLTSSDAKWRCMWYLLVWSIPLTLVSQFLQIDDHIPFYIFAGLSIFVLPLVTAIYSHTAGTRGASLLRVGYVFCDPVLACIAVTPVLLLNHLPHIAQEDNCLRMDTWNDTCDCMQHDNDGFTHPNYRHGYKLDKPQLLIAVGRRSLIIELFMGVPIILALLMWRRTHKMKFSTYLLTFAYWLIISIEAVGLVEAVWQERSFKTVVFTTETIVGITIIITNSYAIVTLCSYISPGNAEEDSKQYLKKFDFLYKVFIGAAGVLFAEIPLLVARCHLFVADPAYARSATFYMWMTKDVIFIVLIIVIILGQKFGQRYIKIRCKVNFDNPDVFFKPEKRDEYIHQKKTVRFQDPPYSTHTFAEETDTADTGSFSETELKLPKYSSSLDDLHQIDMEIPDGFENGKSSQSLPCIQNMLQETDNSLLGDSINSLQYIYQPKDKKLLSPHLQQKSSQQQSADSVLTNNTEQPSCSSSNTSLGEFGLGVHHGLPTNGARPPFRSPVRNSPRPSPCSSTSSVANGPSDSFTPSGKFSRGHTIPPV